jgi:hypothetical protein
MPEELQQIVKTARRIYDAEANSAVFFLLLRKEFCFDLKCHGASGGGFGHQHAERERKQTWQWTTCIPRISPGSLSHHAPPCISLPLPISPCLSSPEHRCARNRKAHRRGSPSMHLFHLLRCNDLSFYRLDWWCSIETFSESSGYYLISVCALDLTLW